MLGRSKYTEWVLNLMLLLMLAFVGILVYWSFHTYEILTPLEGNYQLSREEYKRGDVLEIRFHICKNTSIRERVFGRFVDGVIFSVPDNQSNFDIGCYDTFITSVNIPSTLPSGNYYYEEKVVYEVNPIRTVEYVFRTPGFRVID